MHRMWKKMSLIVLLCYFIEGSSSLDDSSAIYPCPINLAVPMVNKEDIKYFENGSLFYEGYVYPREHYWRDDKSNITLGCVCNLGVKCFRKCCRSDEILHLNVTCVNGAAAKETNFSKRAGRIPELKIPEDNLHSDIKNLTNLDDHFYVLKNRICPNDVYVLEPEMFPADRFVVDYHGVLKTEEASFLPGSYCIDWQIDTDDIRAVVCFPENIEETTTMASTLEMKLYPVGMIISIPFMIATLLVYATISELRNLYGKTLMSYVTCLIYAYSSLAILQLANVSQLFCVSFGEKTI